MALEITAAEVATLPAQLQQTWTNLMEHCGVTVVSGKYSLDETKIQELREDESCRKGLRLFLRALGARRSVETVKKLTEKDKSKSSTGRSRKRTSTEAKNAAKAAELGDDPAPPSPGKKRN